MFERIIMGQSESDIFWFAVPNTSPVYGNSGKPAVDQAKSNVYFTARTPSGDTQLIKMSSLGFMQGIRNFGKDGETQSQGNCSIKGNDWCHMGGTNDTYGVPPVAGINFNTNQTYRNHFYVGGIGSTAGSGICATTANQTGVFICGTWYETQDGWPTGYQRAWIARIDDAGRAWSYVGPYSIRNSFSDVVELPNGNICAVGDAWIDGDGSYVIVFNPSTGTAVEQKALQLASLTCAAVWPDGSLSVGGRADGGNNSFYVAKLNSTRTGSVVWRVRLNAGTCSGIAVDSGGNTIAIATANGYPTIFKFSPTGTLLWQRRFYWGVGSQAGLGVAIGAGDCIYAKLVTGNQVIMLKVPGDGSLTGTYGSYVYEPSSVTTQFHSASGMVNISFPNEGSLLDYNFTRGSWRTSGSSNWSRTLMQ